METALRSRDIASTVVSAMVGAGIFFAPGLLLREGASAPVILLLFLGSGIIAVAGALTVAELASRHPGNGGSYRYIREELGALPAFLFNWTRFSVMQTGALAILALICVRFAANALGFRDPFWEAIVAIGLIAATAALNARGLRLGAQVQVGLTVLKIGVLLAVVVGVLVAARWNGFARPAAGGSQGWGSWMLVSVFAFGGWTQVTFLAGEMRDPRRLAGPMAWSIVGVLALYMIALTAMLLVVPEGAAGDVLMADAAGSLWGSAGMRIVALAVALAVLGGLHTMTLTGPRLYQTAARDGQWWAPFAESNRFAAPGKALFFQAEWAALLVAFSLLASNAFYTLIGSISVAIWLFHVVTALAWFRHRRRTGATPLFATPGGAWVAGFFLLATTTVVGLAVWQDLRFLQDGAWGDLRVVWAFALVALGLLVWALKARLGVGWGASTSKPATADPAPAVAASET